MKLSKDSLTVIKNFANINSNLSIKTGSKMVTMSNSKTVIAEAVLPESFPSDFGIYDLNEFLGILSLFEDPELEFSPKFVTIKQGKNAVKYFAADPSGLTVTPNIKEFPAAEIVFNLPATMLTQIQRVAAILGVTDFSLIGDGSNIFVQVGDKKNPTGNSFNSEIGVTDKDFKVNMKLENLKMLSGDYEVSISSRMISRFKAVNTDLVYYVAVEADSKFDVNE